jgi:hypothetical protein
MDAVLAGERSLALGDESFMEHPARGRIETSVPIASA